MGKSYISKFDADSLPRAFVDKDVLYVAIGINYIKHATENMGNREEGTLLEWNAEQAYALEIADQLNSELGDDGTTLIHVMLDDAIEKAIEDGCCYVKIPGEEE